MATLPGIPAHPFRQHLGIAHARQTERHPARTGNGYGSDTHNIADPDAELNARGDSLMVWIAVFAGAAFVVAWACGVLP